MKYIEDLETMGCMNPECKGSGEHGDFFLGAKCHEHAGLWLHYHEGYLDVYCAVCDEPVAQIAVARREETCLPTTTYPSPN